jgi:nucleoid-associated protein YgaU
MTHVVIVVIVQPGVTLSLIAQHVYGTAAAWPLIYNANRAVVGSDPGLIWPGMRLVMPGPAS